jgi:hypothetical protein
MDRERLVPIEVKVGELSRCLAGASCPTLLRRATMTEKRTI